MAGKNQRIGEAREIKPPKPARGERDEDWRDWIVSKRVQDRILKRQEERRKREEAFRRRKRGRFW